MGEPPIKALQNVIDPVEPAALSDAVSYYVSSSTGNDENDGLTEATPWRTLEKAYSTHRYVPGASILLKRGDIWGGQFFCFGNGDYAKTIYDSTFSTEYSTKLSLYLNNDVFINDKDRRLLAGATSLQATSDATRYCEDLAYKEAQEIADETANTSSSWITLGAYGAGSRPQIITPNSLQTSIKSNRINFTGGWKFIGIDISGARLCGINLERDPGNMINGIRIEDCRIHKISGDSVGNLDSQHPGYLCPFPAGVFTYSCAYLTIIDSQIDSCEWGGEIRVYDYLLVKNTDFLNCSRSGLWLTSEYNSSNTVITRMSTHSQVIDCIINNCGGPLGIWWGSVGLQYDGVVDAGVWGCDIGFIQGGVVNTTPDRIGIDWELPCTRASCRNSVFHDCQGSAFVKFREHTETVIEDCVITNNGLGNASHGLTSPTPAFIRDQAGLNDASRVNFNIITYRSSPIQQTNYFSGAYSNSYPGWYASAYGNIVVL